MPDVMKLKVVGTVVRGAVGPRMEESLQVDVGKVEFANGGIGKEPVMMELEEVAVSVADSTVELAVEELEVPVDNGKVPVPVPMPIDPGAEPRPVGKGPALLKLE